MTLVQWPVTARPRPAVVRRQGAGTTVGAKGAGVGEPIRRRRVCVVGGGISGLATAYNLANGHDPAGGPPPEVTVLEAAERLGGKILTRSVAGHRIDAGPDAILARSPVVERLLTDLGLLEELSRPASRRAYVWARGELRPLPPSSLFGVPETPLPLLRSRVLSPWGALRAGADFVLPRRALPPDPTISQLLRPRFGREVFDQLVEPMLGGVHAGRADALSARSAVPEVYVAARANRSTYLALRRRETPTSAGLGMVTVRGGLERLVGALRAGMPGVELRTGAEVVRIERSRPGYTLDTRAAGGAERLHADAVVLATPAYTSARLLRPLSAGAAGALEAIPYVGVATVLLAYRRSAVGRALDGTGFLVPPREGRLVVGCTWSSVKWQHLVDQDVAVFRCAVGRHGDTRWESLDDETLVERVHEEMVESMGMSAPPEEVVVQRWPAAMPQYTVGHEHRLVALAQALHELPGMHVTGAAFRGVGIAGCVVQAADVAEAVRAHVHGVVEDLSPSAATGDGGAAR